MGWVGKLSACHARAAGAHTPSIFRWSFMFYYSGAVLPQDPFSIDGRPFTPVEQGSRSASAANVAHLSLLAPVKKAVPHSQKPDRRELEAHAHIITVLLVVQ